MRIKSFSLISIAALLCLGAPVLTGAARAQSYTLTTIDDPGALALTTATEINDNGDIVGYYSDSSGQPHGFFYNAKTASYTTLDDPSGTNTNAFGINDNGYIVGFYRDAIDQTHGFLATPTGGLRPEF